MGAGGTKAGRAMGHAADRASSPPPTVHASPRLSVLHQTTRNAAAQRSPLTIHRCFQPLPRSLSRAAPGRHRARRGAAITRPLACRREVGQGSGVSWEPRAALVMAEHLGGRPSILLLGMGPLRRAVARLPSPAIRGRSHGAPLAQRSSAMGQGGAPRSPGLGRAEGLAALGGLWWSQSRWSTSGVIQAASSSSSQVCCGAPRPAGPPTPPNTAPAGPPLTAPGRHGARGGDAITGPRVRKGGAAWVGARSGGYSDLLVGALGPVGADWLVHWGGRVLRLFLHAVRPIFAALFIWLRARAIAAA